MAQNSMRIRWTREEVDARLFNIMKTIHEVCARTAEKYGTPGNYVNGANIAGFVKVADAMLDQGLVCVLCHPGRSRGGGVYFCRLCAVCVCWSLFGHGR